MRLPKVTVYAALNKRQTPLYLDQPVNINELILSLVAILTVHFTSKIVSMIRKYHNHKLQTTPGHREEQRLNHHETPGRFGQAQNMELIKMFLWLLFCVLCSNVSALDINQHACSEQDLTLKCVYD